MDDVTLLVFASGRRMEDFSEVCFVGSKQRYFVVYNFGVREILDCIKVLYGVFLLVDDGLLVVETNSCS